MPSLQQILAQHGSALLLDAASTRVQVGLVRRDAPAIWANSDAEAGTALFNLTEKLLQEAHLTIRDLGSFVFCEGPGSMLGIRTVAMALRTWQALSPRPIFAYQSLAVAGTAAARTNLADHRFAVIADARRDTWHVQVVEANGTLRPLERIATAALPQELALITPEYFRAWSALPATARVCSYELATIFPAVMELDCLRPTETPDAFQHEAPEYKKWSAQVHSAVTAPPK